MRLLMSLSNLVRLCLSEWISFLLPAVPIRSRATFIELLCGCLVPPEGWVTRFIIAISRRKHWTTYYKLIERGSVRTVRLARALFRLVIALALLRALAGVADKPVRVLFDSWFMRARLVVPFLRPQVRVVRQGR